MRALEWDRRDLLGSDGDADSLERRYAAFLGLEPPPEPAPAAPDSPVSAPSVERVSGIEWLPLVAGLVPLLAITVVYLLGEDESGLRDLRAHAVSLIVISSLLLIAAGLPNALVARTPLGPPARFARYRQPLALAGIGVLVPVTVYATLVALT